MYHTNDNLQTTLSLTCNLPDFAGMDTQFFVQEAAGQVVNQDRAVAGAWGHEKEQRKK